jgi:hypothetical protein
MPRVKPPAVHTYGEISDPLCHHQRRMVCGAYRFGGAELSTLSGPSMVGEFFERLFRAYRLSL